MAVPRKILKRKSASTPALELVAAPHPPEPTPDDDESVLSLKSGEEVEMEEEQNNNWYNEAGSQLTQAESLSPADRREVDQLTDRIFSAVLSRYGWEQHGNRIEHVGEDRRRR